MPNTHTISSRSNDDQRDVNAATEAATACAIPHQVYFAVDMSASAAAHTLLACKQAVHCVLDDYDSCEESDIDIFE